MKLVVALVTLVCWQTVLSADPKSKDQGKTEKRALVEGNAALNKRAPTLAAASPSPSTGIIYADTTETLSDKSPTQQLYATPVPQVAKISDVLTGHGPSFPTAIENHLYSPVQVYQPRLGSPTTYEISAPIASQLAYTEHKIYQQPQLNSLQNFDQQKSHQKQLARVTVNFGPQPFQQQVYYQQPPVYQQQPHLVQHQPYLQSAQIHQYQLTNNRQPNTYNQQPVAYNQQPVAYNQQLVAYNQQPVAYNQQPVVYNQQPVAYNQQTIDYNQPSVAYNQPPVAYNQQPVVYNQQPIAYNQQQLAYNQSPLHQFRLQSPINILPQTQPGITYVEQQQKYNGLQPTRQGEVKIPKPDQVKIFGKSTLIQQNINDKSHGAVSYASFSQSQPSANFISPATNFLPPSAPSNYLSPNTKLEAPISPTTEVPTQKPDEAPNVTPVHPNSRPVQAFFRPQYISSVPQFYSPQPQLYAPQPQQILVQNPGLVQQPIAVAPTFAPIQYFGKFAPTIFGAYNH